MNVSEKGISKPPDSLDFIKDDGLRGLWSTWFTKVWNQYPRVRSYESAMTPSAVGATSESVQTFTIEGLATKDNVVVNKPTNQSGLDLVHTWVSAADTLSIKYRNHSGSPVTPTAETYRIVAVRR